MDKINKLSRGGVYLATLNPTKKNEVGKIRPVVILTAQNILDQNPAIVFICPLSSQSFRKYACLHILLSARDKLEVESYALTEHCRSMSIERIKLPRIAQLFPEEIDAITKNLRVLIDAI